MMKKLFTVLLLLFCSQSFVTAQWTDVSTGKTSQISNCIALDANTCIAVGTFGKIFRTADGGMTYDSVQTVFQWDIFSDIDFPNDSVGYICGGTFFGTHTTFLLRTTDRGLTWDSVNSDIFQAQMIEKIEFIDAQIGFLIVDNGNLYKTTDGGQTFAQMTLPPASAPLRIEAVNFSGPQTGYVSSTHIMSPGDYAYRIDKTTDQGLTWNTVWTDTLVGGEVWTDRRMSSIHFLSNLEGFAGGANGHLLHTTDGGQNWSSSVLVSDTTFLIDIHFSDANNGFISGIFAYGGAAKPYFYTADGGQTWQRHASESFYNMSFAGAAGYAVGNGSKLFATQTGGLSIEGPQAGLNLQVFPNPATNQLSVRLPHSLTGSRATITDINGKVLRHLSLTGPEQTVDLRGLAFGTYFLTLDHPKEGRISKKFTVIGY